MTFKNTVMKTLLIVCIALLVLNCKEEAPKDYVTLSGKIEHPHESKTLRIFKGRLYEKVITLEEDGTFKDTLKITEGNYSFQHGNQDGDIFLKNNNVSTLNTNFEDFDNAMTFGGDAADVNNLSMQAYLISNIHFDDKLISSGVKKDLDKALVDYKTAYENLKSKYPDVDSTQVALIDRNVAVTSSQISKYMASKIAMREAFPKGKKSPEFNAYENYAGGNTALKDLKGKYVYIDVWATWCGPCKAEIPSLKKLEKQYEGKNIQFVSISVDEGRGYNGDASAAYEGWKKMIAEQQLTGIQLMADNGFRSQFIQDYKINGIPRFILIDPNGNIVDADAPRPSNPQLISVFEDLNI